MYNFTLRRYMLNNIYLKNNTIINFKYKSKSIMRHYLLLALALLMGAATLSASETPTVIRTEKAYVVKASLAKQGTSTIKKVAANILTFNKSYKLYKRPAGAFNSSFMVDGHWWKNSTNIGQPRRAMTFMNIDPAGTSSTKYVWTNDVSFTTVGKNMRVIMDPNTYSHMPILTATNNGVETSYQAGCYAKNGTYYPSWIYSYPDIAKSGYWEVGTSKSFTAPGDSSVTIVREDGVTVTSDQPDMTLAVDGEQGSFWFGKNKYYNTCGEAFEAPANPYVLRSVYVMYRHAADNAVDSLATMICTGTPELTVRVYKLASIPAYNATSSVSPVLGDLIGTGTAKLDMSASIPGAAYGGENDGLMVYPLKFDLQDANGNAIQPQIETPIIILVSGYDSNDVTRFEIPVSADVNDDGFGELGYLGNIKDGVVTELKGINNLLTAGAIKTAPAICIDVYNPYLNFGDGTDYNVDRQRSYTIGAAGETKTVQFISSQPATEIKFTQRNGSALPDWIKATVAQDSHPNDYDYLCTATFTIAPNTGAVRSDSVKVAVNGAYDYCIFNQGTSGVANVQVLGNKAYTANGNFVVNVTGANDKVDIYTVSGQLVKSVKVNEGNSIIDAQDLVKGLYILRFSDGTAVKVVR
jgi:hypothetical protein